MKAAAINKAEGSRRAKILIAEADAQARVKVFYLPFEAAAILISSGG